MKMPILQPLPIATTRQMFLMRVWTLLTVKRRWTLTEDWFYKLPNNRTIVIPKDFVFDGSSYPAIVWLIFSQTGLMLIPTLIHDFTFKYNYLIGVTSTGERYKYQENKGFMYWNALARQVGTARNNIGFVDIFIWILTIVLGGFNWYQQRKLASIEPATFFNDK